MVMMSVDTEALVTQLVIREVQNACKPEYLQPEIYMIKIGGRGPNIRCEMANCAMREELPLMRAHTTGSEPTPTRKGILIQLMS